MSGLYQISGNAQEGVENSQADEGGYRALGGLFGDALPIRRGLQAIVNGHSADGHAENKDFCRTDEDILPGQGPEERKPQLLPIDVGEQLPEQVAADDGAEEKYAGKDGQR